MGLEIYIGAKIFRKSDHTPVTVGCPKEKWDYCGDWSREYFEVCYWKKDSEIFNFLREHYTFDDDNSVSLPANAMRPIYAKAVEFSYGDEEDCTGLIMENQNVRNAYHLGNVLTAIGTGHYGDSTIIPEGCFCEGFGFEKLQKHPDDFEWEFNVIIAGLILVPEKGW
mgnify:CR=1 FL=1